MNHKYYLREAYLQAMHSPDPSTQCGAVLVGREGDIMSAGFNGFHDGVKPPKDLLNVVYNRDEKLSRVQHAERRTLHIAFQFGFTYADFQDATLYAPFFACADCAKTIIEMGVRRVIGHDLCRIATPSRWENSINIGLKMFKEAGVEYSWHDCIINDNPIPIHITFNGKDFKP